MDKNTFKGDIERAERLTLIISWAGIFASIGVIAFSIWGIS
tara:strand:+ start:235 stop:357 length:123 start_codon:yes stop_codon:yes gene_type:complete